MNRVGILSSWVVAPLLFLLSALLAANASHAQGALHLLAAAETEIEQLEFERAAELLREVIVQPDLDEKDLIRARAHLGACDFITGNLSDARLHYRWLLAKDDAFTLAPGASQKVHNFFRIVKDEWGQERSLKRREAEQKETEQKLEPVVSQTSLAVAPDEVLPQDEAVEESSILVPGILTAAAAIGILTVAATATATTLWVLNAPTLGEIDLRRPAN